MPNVAVFGTGYVGCVTAVCLARDGHQVIGVDIDAEKVDEINRGRAPVSEPGLEELLKEQVSAGRLRATTDLTAAVRDSAIAMISVGTPSSSDGAVNTSALERVIHDIGSALSQFKQQYAVVVRSTLLPGILEDHLAPLLSESAGRTLGTDLSLCNNPEFLREGSAIKDYDNPPFVVVGTLNNQTADSVLELYASINAPHVTTDTRTAALLKYACNAFHAAKVAFANEMGSLAKSFQADGHEVMRLACMDDKLNISPAYLRPGYAFGGSCLPKDLRALTRFAQQQAIEVELLDAILTSNEQHLRRAVQLIQNSGARKVGLVGLSFKAGTDDLRESPQVSLAETLLGRGSDIKIYDPGVSLSRLRGANLAYVDRHLPHLAALLVENPKALCDHAELLVLGSAVADGFDWRTEFTGELIDLRQDLVAFDAAKSAQATASDG